jgi:hypothetical protein
MFSYGLPIPVLLGRTSPFSAMRRNQMRLLMIAGAFRPLLA